MCLVFLLMVVISLFRHFVSCRPSFSPYTRPSSNPPFSTATTREPRSPRRLCLWNTKKDHSICEVNFLTAVLAVKLNRKRVAVCLKSALHVFDISDMKCLRTLETAPNPDGVMALSPNEENCHLAFPDGARSGGGGGAGEVRAGGGQWGESVGSELPHAVVRSKVRSWGGYTGSKPYACPIISSFMDLR